MPEISSADRIFMRWPAPWIFKAGFELKFFAKAELLIDESLGLLPALSLQAALVLFVPWL